MQKKHSALFFKMIWKFLVNVIRKAKRIAEKKRKTRKGTLIGKQEVKSVLIC
jgi:hypothetical protein